MHKNIAIDEELLDEFVAIIEEHEDDLIYDYKGKENQILLKSPLVRKLATFIHEHLESEEYTLKDIVKAYIRAAFELSDNAVVINKSGHIFIKIIDETVQQKVDEKDKNTVKNRYNGVNEDELKSFYTEFFDDEENSEFFQEVAQEFVTTYLLKKKISNEEYEQYVFSYIHKIILNKFLEIYDDDENFFLGFAGYVFRIHFKEVFELIAELILDEVAIANPVITDFLSYYTHDILVINGTKYKIPPIEAENGLRWTIPSMLSVVKIHTKTKHTIKALTQKRDKLKKEVERFYVNGLSPIKSNERLQTKKHALDTKIEKLTFQLNRFNEKLEKATEALNIKNIKEEIYFIKEKLRELRVSREDIVKKTVKQQELIKYISLQKELDSINRKLQREKKTLEQNAEAYSSIRKALAKALISKKTPLKKEKPAAS